MANYPGLQRSAEGRERDADHEDDESDESDYEEQAKDEGHLHDWLESNPDSRVIFQPDPTQTFIPLERRIEEQGRVDLRNDFDGLQIIFKLASIHLTPEKPLYGGSNWHVEGALNEHICATALFYYDQENIEDNYLEFREQIDTEAMSMKPGQFEYAAVEDLYGVKNEENGSAIEYRGRVATKPGTADASSSSDLIQC